MNSTKETSVPTVPAVNLMAERDCFKHPNVRPLKESVSSRIEALLARADGLMTGREYHVLFDARGQKHARRVAQADQVQESGTCGEERGGIGQMGSSDRRLGQ